jgi:hypothetical protein
LQARSRVELEVSGDSLPPVGTSWVQVNDGGLADSAFAAGQDFDRQLLFRLKILAQKLANLANFGQQGAGCRRMIDVRGSSYACAACGSGAVAAPVALAANIASCSGLVGVNATSEAERL